MPKRSETTEHGGQPRRSAIGCCSEDEFLYRLGPNKRTRLRREYNIWAKQRMADGRRFGTRRHLEGTTLSVTLRATARVGEKEYDCNAAMQTLKAIFTLRYRIEKP